MKELRIGDIYYWYQPYGNEKQEDRLCVVTREMQDPSSTDWATVRCAYYDCDKNNKSFWDYTEGMGWSAVPECMEEEIKQGRLHYIGKV